MPTTLKEVLLRLNELETRFAFQEDLVESLNTTVANQQEELEKLWQANRVLKQQLTKLEYHAGGRGDEAPPPHY